MLKIGGEGGAVDTGDGEPEWQGSTTPTSSSVTASTSFQFAHRLPIGTRNGGDHFVPARG